MTTRVVEFGPNQASSRGSIPKATLSFTLVLLVTQWAQFTVEVGQPTSHDWALNFRSHE